MLLKYNKNNINYERKNIDISNVGISEENGYFVLNFTTNTPHNLNIGEKIFLSKNGKIIEPSEMLNDVKIIENGYSDTTFSVILKKSQTLTVSELYKGNKQIIIKTNENFLCLDEEIEKGGTFHIKKIIYKYKEVSSDNDVRYKVINKIPENSFLGNVYVLYNNTLYHWEKDEDVKEIEGTYINNNIFSVENEKIGNNDIFELIDYRFIKNENNIISLNDNINILGYGDKIILKIPFINNNGINLNNEHIIHHYFNEKKQELIPEIIDYEKCVFTPCYKNNNKLIPAENITFNLFFRDRTGNENWNTDDTKGWNQYKTQIDSNGNSSWLLNTESNGDLLGHLGFTDEDVYYRKQKISKSFIRLSFYDTNNPVNQTLLYYSTIFLDAGDLYSKYIKNINGKNISNVVNKNIFGDDNLTASFTVSDKYNRKKSSEGFYLYLFPDIIKENNTKTIYMKVEFNHAGYGKNIPFIYPNKNGLQLLNFSDNDFPKSLIDDKGTLTELYRQLYIPIILKYDNELKDYVYYFDFAKAENNDITFNLYEPKINSI